MNPDGLSWTPHAAAALNTLHTRWRQKNTIYMWCTFWVAQYYRCVCAFCNAPLLALCWNIFPIVKLIMWYVILNTLVPSWALTMHWNNNFIGFRSVDLIDCLTHIRPWYLSAPLNTFLWFSFRNWQSGCFACCFQCQGSKFNLLFEK